MIKRLKEKTEGKYDRVFTSHGRGEEGVELLDGVIAVAEDILSGKADNVPFRGFGGEKAFIAKKMDMQRFCRADGGNWKYYIITRRIFKFFGAFSHMLFELPGENELIGITYFLCYAGNGQAFRSKRCA
jgi:hypothetical protein